MPERKLLKTFQYVRRDLGVEFILMIVQLNIEPVQDEKQLAQDDVISDPEEDTIAGQMAAIRGGQVKKRPDVEESDDDSSTEEEEDNDDDDSDSDSD